MQFQYTTPREIYGFLQQQKAPERLIKHHKLVVEATEEIITDLKTNFPNLDCNYQQVLIGAAIHDAGKIIFNNEIYKSGNRHELEGEQYLINLGIPPRIARFFFRTHGHWNDPNNTIEDLLVAVADVLWKGCRNEQLENLVIQKISTLMEKDFWDVFLIVDYLFEKVSDCGTDRLNRSLSF